MGSHPLADRLQLDPGVGAAHLHGRVVVEDMVTKVVQWRLGVRGGKLGGVFNLFPHRHVDLLQSNRIRQNKVFRVKSSSLAVRCTM